MSISYDPRRCPALEGHIMMLPKKEEVEAMWPAGLNIDSGVFNHPVVVLSKQAVAGIVAVFVITSFDATPIETRYQDPVRRQHYLPISPAQHPDTSVSLTLAHGKTMKKNSYVNTKTVHELPQAVLRYCWGDRHLHLDDESRQAVVTKLWKQGLDDMGERLSGHGISERQYQAATVKTSVPVQSSQPLHGSDVRTWATVAASRSQPAVWNPSTASDGTYAPRPANPPRSHAVGGVWLDEAQRQAWYDRRPPSASSRPVPSYGSTSNYRRPSSDYPVQVREDDSQGGAFGLLLLVAVACVTGWYWLSGH